MVCVCLCLVCQVGKPQSLLCHSWVWETTVWAAGLISVLRMSTLMTTAVSFTSVTGIQLYSLHLSIQPSIHPSISFQRNSWPAKIAKTTLNMQNSLWTPMLCNATMKKKKENRDWYWHCLQQAFWRLDGTNSHTLGLSTCKTLWLLSRSQTAFSLCSEAWSLQQDLTQSSDFRIYVSAFFSVQMYG